MKKKTASRAGFAVIFAVLIAAILVLLILLAIPTYKYYTDRAAAYGCASELASAKSVLTIEYLTDHQNMSAEDTKDIVSYCMDGWDDLCPGGGTTYVIDNPDEGLPYLVVCGLHDKDENRRTRLNASYCLLKLRESVSSYKKRGKEIPETIDLMLNGRELTAQRTEELPSFTRGTATTRGYQKKENVLFFTVDDDDQITGLVYADTEHCAIYNSSSGWSGDSYDVMGVQ